MSHAWFWWAPIGNWLYSFFGIGGSGSRYGFWSGAGSDITELAIIGALVQTARHVNCHQKGCWRVGKPVAGTPFRACHHHHRDHPGDKRNVDLAAVLAQPPDSAPPGPPTVPGALSEPADHTGA